jgi:hypothetical protein
MNKNFNQSDEYIKNCENINLLLSEMEAARCGIENLKFTYQNDPNIVSQIDIIILKTNTALKDMYNKLYYFESFLQTPTPTQPKFIRNDNLSNTESLSYQYHTDQNKDHVDQWKDQSKYGSDQNKDQSKYGSDQNKDESVQSDNETDDNADE